MSTLAKLMQSFGLVTYTSLNPILKEYQTLLNKAKVQKHMEMGPKLSLFSEGIESASLFCYWQ